MEIKLMVTLGVGDRPDTGAELSREHALSAALYATRLAIEEAQDRGALLADMVDVAPFTGVECPAPELSGMITKERAIDQFVQAHGGYWTGECVETPLADWWMEVRNGDTRMSYWEWAWRQMECED